MLLYIALFELYAKYIRVFLEFIMHEFTIFYESWRIITWVYHPPRPAFLISINSNYEHTITTVMLLNVESIKYWVSFSQRSNYITYKVFMQ